ncbi:hypothetical protein ACKLTP_18575, partial [Paenarthrobacter ureafaciens]|uniref:hypothetical protein n=1 Tax=Paenarthrobacter ureafaciens TaxID=37931 RepID=UPI00397B6C23
NLLFVLEGHTEEVTDVAIAPNKTYAGHRCTTTALLEEGIMIAGQLDIFELLEAPAAAAQPPFKVQPLGWHGPMICGWCGGPGFLGGGACRWPEDTTVSIGYQYCQKCIDKYGHPKVFAGGTPLVMMTRDEMRIFFLGLEQDAGKNYGSAAGRQPHPAFCR